MSGHSDNGYLGQEKGKLYPNISTVSRATVFSLSEQNARVFDTLAGGGSHGPLTDKELDALPLEEFLHAAKLEREYERPLKTSNSVLPGITGADVKWLFGRGEHGEAEEKQKELVEAAKKGYPTEQDWINATRAARQATWVGVFYLITTDILGPTSAPFAVSQLGYVPGALMFLLFGAVAAYCGVLLMDMFLKLDSARYPMLNFGDAVGRIYGRNVRYFSDALQALQLLFNVAVIILGNGQGLAQIAQNKVCFAGLTVIWAAAGMIVGQIRSLQRFGFLANLAIWLNLFVVFATMGEVAISPPLMEGNAAGVPAVGPKVSKVVVSGMGNFVGQSEAAMNIVYSFGGGLIFIEIMNEMKRPMDFWKGMAIAQAIIFTCYLWYGLMVYAYQGQFVHNPANQGISNYNWQTACNVLNLVSSLIAAGLYGNLGIKTIYRNFMQRFIKALPDCDGPTWTARMVWVGTVFVYWSVAYVIASAIPNFSALSSLVAAICIMQFSYTFPPIMRFGLDMQMHAMKGDGEYDHVNKAPNRIDSWRNFSRWRRGLAGNPLLHTLNIVIFFGALAATGIGIYGAVEGLKESFAAGSVSSFRCKLPGT